MYSKEMKAEKQAKEGGCDEEEGYNWMKNTYTKRIKIFFIFLANRRRCDE